MRLTVMETNPQTDTKQASLDEARAVIAGADVLFRNRDHYDVMVEVVATALSSLRQEIAAKDAELVKANMLACANAEDAADESERAAKTIDFAARRLAAKDADIKRLGEQMVTERLHGYELLERAERAEAQLAEVDAHRRKVLAENERLLNGFIEKERQLAEANKALDAIIERSRDVSWSEAEYVRVALDTRDIARRAREAQGGENG